MKKQRPRNALGQFKLTKETEASRNAMFEVPLNELLSHKRKLTRNERATAEAKNQVQERLRRTHTTKRKLRAEVKAGKSEWKTSGPGYTKTVKRFHGKLDDVAVKAKDYLAVKARNKKSKSWINVGRANDKKWAGSRVGRTVDSKLWLEKVQVGNTGSSVSDSLPKGSNVTLEIIIIVPTNTTKKASSKRRKAKK